MFNNSKITSALDKLVNLFALNILFILTSIPIVTIGPSLSALYTVNLKLTENKEGYIARDYFRAFRKNFKLSLLGFLPLSIFGTIMGLNIYITHSATSTVFIFINLLSLFSLAIVGIIALYFFPIVARFHFTIKQVFLHIPHMVTSKPLHFFTLILPLIPIIFFALYSIYTLLFTAAFFLLIGFSLLSFVQCHTFLAIFTSYENKQGEID